MIRNATLEDLPRVVEMAERFIHSTDYHELLDASPEAIGDFVQRLLAAGGQVWVSEEQALERDGSTTSYLVGLLVLAVFTHPMTGKTVAEEVAWWVPPERRGGLIGPRLMHKMECWCMQNRVYMVKMVAPEGSAVGDFYRKCGYRATETAWIKVLT